MDVYDLFLFERSGKLLFRRSGVASSRVMQDERDKLVYGLLFSFKQLIPLLARKEQITEEGIRSFSTPQYTLHCFETATGYRVVAITSVCNLAQQAEVRRVLEQRVFQDLFVGMVMMDPNYLPKSKIDNPAFTKQVDAVLDALKRKA